MDIGILYEDSEIIAVNKPEGLLTIPGREGSAEPSLLDWLARRAGAKIFVVHRLDRPVSGAVVFARNELAHRELCQAFEARTVEKHYLALAQGQFESFSGTINKPLREFGSGRVGVDPGGGKPSVTSYFVLEKLYGYSLLDIELVTGRRHQIRAHFYSIGHPLVGDPEYGDPEKQACYPRLMLHSHTLRLPRAGRRALEITAPAPDSFTAVIKQLKTCGSL
ncbi:MAG: RluA family pseudouridine synthase [Elusimicrobiaceae bacterium]|nr:RluA family pseudouridine synthase [Elusimicrobiaceae bacterium]